MRNAERKSNENKSLKFAIPFIPFAFSITSIQQRLKARTVSDLDYDEVLYHILRSSQVFFHSTVDEDSYQVIKDYIQGKKKLYFGKYHLFEC